MVAISMEEISTAALRTSTPITCTAVVGTRIGETTTANGVGGTAISGATHTTTWCLLAVLAFHGGGAGDGALGQAGAGDIRTATVTVTTDTVILTMAAAMVLPIMAKA